jgi:hypothetical protein
MEDFEEFGELPNGKQCYVLTHNDRDGNRTICTTLVVMTEVFCRDEDVGRHIRLGKPARSDVRRFFEELTGKIGRVMDGGRGGEGELSW